jgi:hypothetical protein
MPDLKHQVSASPCLHNAQQKGCHDACRVRPLTWPTVQREGCYKSHAILGESEHHQALSGIESSISVKLNAHSMHEDAMRHANREFG